jgi:Mn2+/Fe2+ NRAMP family transporter
VVYRTILPSISFESAYVVAVVAVFGTTISPYLFFRQASQEVEERRAAGRTLKEARASGHAITASSRTLTSAWAFQCGRVLHHAHGNGHCACMA